MEENSAPNSQAPFNSEQISPKPLEPNPNSLNQPTQNPKTRKFSKILVIVLLALFVFGGSAAGYFGYIVPNKPENVLLSAVDNLTSEETKLENAKFKILFETWPRKDYTPLINVSGSFAGSDLEADINIAMVGQTPVISFKKVGQDYYLKIDNVKNSNDLAKSYANYSGNESPEEILAELADSIGDKVLGSWFKIPQSSAESLANMSNVEIPLENLNQNENVLADLINSGAFTLNEFVGKEEIGGVESNHYKINVTKSGLKTFVATYVNKLNIDAFQSTQLQEEIDKLDDRLLVFDLWVHTKLKVINKILIDTSPVTGENYLKFNFELSGINEGLSITAPQDAKSFEQLATELLFQGSLEELY